MTRGQQQVHILYEIRNIFPNSWVHPESYVFLDFLSRNPVILKNPSLIVKSWIPFRFLKFIEES